MIHTLNDPLTLAQVSALAKRIVNSLLEDPSMRAQVVQLVRTTLADPQTRQSVLILIEDLMKDDRTRGNLRDLMSHALGQDPVKATVANTIRDAVHDVLSRPDIQNHAKEFVGTVVKDQTVQAQSGDAIWSTIMYAVTPSWFAWIWQNDDHDYEPEGLPENLPVVVEPPQDVIVQQPSSELVAASAAVNGQPEPFVSESSLARRESKKLATRLSRGGVNSTPKTAPQAKTSLGSSPFVETYEEKHWSGAGGGFH